MNELLPSVLVPPGALRASGTGELPTNPLEYERGTAVPPTPGLAVGCRDGGITPATRLPVTVGVAPMNDPLRELNGLTVGVRPRPTGDRVTGACRGDAVIELRGVPENDRTVGALLRGENDRTVGALLRGENDRPVDVLLRGENVRGAEDRAEDLGTEELTRGERLKLRDPPEDERGEKLRD